MKIPKTEVIIPEITINKEHIKEKVRKIANTLTDVCCWDFRNITVLGLENNIKLIGNVIKKNSTFHKTLSIYNMMYHVEGGRCVVYCDFTEKSIVKGLCFIELFYLFDTHYTQYYEKVNCLYHGYFLLKAYSNHKDRGVIFHKLYKKNSKKVNFYFHYRKYSIFTDTITAYKNGTVVFNNKYLKNKNGMLTESLYWLLKDGLSDL